MKEDDGLDFSVMLRRRGQSKTRVAHPDAGAPLADAAILSQPGDFSLPSQALARFSPCFLMSADQEVAALEGAGGI
jgi:hypothetical protein